MHQYVCNRAVTLQGDKKEEVLEYKTVGEQLASIISHIEDLEVVNERVMNSDLAVGYLNPLASDKSEIRLDYWAERVLFSKAQLHSEKVKITWL